MGDHPLRKSKRRSNERGSVYVEMIFFIPMAALIWVMLNFVYDAKKSAVHTQRNARECAWEFAMDGCLGSIPAKCSGSGMIPVVDAELRARGGGSFETVAKAVPWAAPYFVSMAGLWFDVKSEKNIPRPGILGGSTTSEGHFAMLCAEDPPYQWHTPEFFTLFCKKHGDWCP